MMMKVELEQDMWNGILMLLAEHPYKQSAPLIQGITNQLRQQMEPQDQQIQTVRPNGEARPGA